MLVGKQASTVVTYCLISFTLLSDRSLWVPMYFSISRPSGLLTSAYDIEIKSFDSITPI